ncbi:MAG: Single-stranded DNA binding protein [Halobacteriales archaeon]|nr:Single-stranded DNA binding protein [Halobacteriales archaeon]
MSVEDKAEELASDLGVDKEEVQRSLENLLEYSVPMDEAVESLRRKYGGGSDSAEPESVDVAEITTESANITLTAVVLTKGRRSIRYQGEEQVIQEGELADATGKIDYTAWADVDFEPGDTVSIANAGVREWNDQPELNIGENTTVTTTEQPIEVDYPIGGDRDLLDLSPGDRGITVEVRVEEVETRTIDGRDGETEILSGVLADETARLPFTDWEPHDVIETGATLRIEDVYIREFRGVPSVNISEFSTLSVIDRTIDAPDATRMSIQDAVATGGAFDVEVTGHVVGIRDGSGLIQRCPECGRVIQKGQCRSHGDVEGVDDLRVKAIIDDGTGTVTAVLDDELTAEIYGGGIEAAQEAAREAMDQEVVTDELRETLVGKEYEVRGNLSVDDYGANIEASAFTEVQTDPQDRASAFLNAIDTDAGVGE